MFICLLTHPKSYWAEILRDYFPSDADILGHRPFTKKSKKNTYNAGNNHSIKAIGCQWVSLCVCLFVPYLLQNREPQWAEILRDDSPWDAECFRLKNIRIRRTFSREKKKLERVQCALYDLQLSIPFIYHFSPIVTTRHS